MRIAQFGLLCTVLFVSGCGGSSPTGTVTEFYESIERGKHEEAVELLSGPMVEMVGSEKLLQGLREATRKMSDKGGVDTFKIVEKKEIGEIAEVQIEIRYGNGEIENEKVSLVKEDGEWRIELSK